MTSPGAFAEAELGLIGNVLAVVADTELTRYSYDVSRNDWGTALATPTHIEESAWTGYLGAKFGQLPARPTTGVLLVVGAIVGFVQVMDSGGFM